MRKITSIATALLLGGFAFSANAQDYPVNYAEPSVDPAAGSLLTKNADSYNVSWGDNVTLELNSESSCYYEETSFFGETEGLIIPELYVNGKQFVPQDKGMLNGIIDFADWDFATNSGTDPFLKLTYNGTNTDLGELPYVLKWVVPEGAILLKSGSEVEVNKELSFIYYVGYTEMPEPMVSPSDQAPITYIDYVNVCWGLPIELTEGNDLNVTVSYNNGEAVEVTAEVDEYGFYDEELQAIMPSLSINLYPVVSDENYMLKGGAYKVIVPAGIVTVPGTDLTNEVVTLNYILNTVNGNYTLEPEGGYGVMYPASDLSAVTASWPGFSFISYNASLPISAVKQNDSQTGPMALADAVTDGVLNPELVTVDKENASIILDLSGLGEGTWNIEIPSGYASFNEYTVTGTVYLNYTIFNGLATATVLQPEGEIVNSPVPVNLTWNYVNVSPTATGLSASLSYAGPDYETVTVEVPAANFKFATINQPSDGDNHEPMPYADASGNLLSIDLKDLLEGVTGSVTLTIPEGIVADADGLVNPKQEIQFQIIPAFTGEYNAEITENVLTLTWDDTTGAWPIASGTAPFIEDAEGVVFTFEVYDNVYSTDYNNVVFDLAAADLADGDYTLVVPGNFAEIETEDGRYMNVEIYISLNVKNGVVTIQEPAAPSYLPAPSITPTDESTLYGGSIPNVVLEWDEELTATSETLKVNLTYKGETKEIEAYLYDSGAYDETAEDYVPAAPYMLVVDWSDETINKDDWSTYAGEYTITIPSGLVKNAEGDVNAQYVLAYTVYGVKGYEEIIPDPNAWTEDWTARKTYTSAELEEVLVEFNYELTAVTPQPEITVTLMSSNQGGVSPHAAGNVLDPSLISVEGKNIVLDLSGLGDGEWLIEIPAGFAQINEDTYTNFADFTYIIDNNASMPVAEVIGGLENNGQYATENLPEYAMVTWGFENIELTGEGTVVVEIEDMINYGFKSIELPADAVVLRYAVPAQEGGEVAPLADADEDEAYNALEINFGEYLPEINLASYVTVVIPAGFVTNGEQMNEIVNLTVDVYPLYGAEPTFTNNDGKVAITWGYDFLVVNPDADQAYLSDTEGNQIALPYESAFENENAPMSDKLDEDGNAIALVANLDELDIVDGTYTLWIPLGYVRIIPEDNSNMWFNRIAYWSFDIKDGVITGSTSGIESIESAAPAIEGVYNLQGVKMSNDLNSLAPGLYIINGKKVLVRK